MAQHRPTLLQLLPFPIHPDAQTRLERDYSVVRLWEQDDPNSVMAVCRDEVTVVVTSAFMPVRRKLIDQLPRLQAICSVGVGYDHIDWQDAQQRGVQVSNTPDVLNDCVADLAWGLLLDVARDISRADRYVRANQWELRLAELPLGRQVTGKKLGIVGLGRVGAAIAKRAFGFEMQVRYHNRRPRNDVSWPYESSLHDLARWADFLVVATVGGDQTRHLIDQAVLEALGPDGVLINISRGSVVDENALVQALQNKVIAGAGLDVFENEPHVPDELKTMDNVVLVPHIASATTETRQAMVDLMLQNVEAFSQTSRVLTPVSP